MTSMATVRRLDDASVREIFEALHNNRPPPSHLPFQIVPVGPEGLRLSPPSYAFKDGLYVLLKPQKKKKDINAPGQPKVPSNLIHMVMPQDDVPGLNCPWSLSGPQFPTPTAIQQRYCYPKGDPEYSSQKGGALWTMYGQDGKEDMEYRLLHVYFSAKRAINKGASPRPTKRTKKSTPGSRGSHGSRQSPAKLPRGPTNRILSPPGLPRAPTSPPEDQVAAASLHQTQAYITPQTTHSTHQSTPRLTYNHPNTNRSHLDLPDTVTEQDALNNATFNPFGEDFDTWTGPNAFGPNMGDDDILEKKTMGERLSIFAANLERIHAGVREAILLKAPDAEQGHLISMFADWGRQIAESPLGDVEAKKGSEDSFAMTAL